MTALKNTQETIALPTHSVQIVTKEQIIDTTLAQYLADSGRGLIVYFYPKDNTQGCSVQAMDFSADQDTLRTLGFDVLGVSRDGVKSHQNFIAKKELNIDLISDTDETLCQHFDVIKEKMMYGKTHLGVVRSTFVFDKNGVMIGSFRNVKAKEHASQLIDFLRNLPA